MAKEPVSIYNEELAADVLSISCNSAKRRIRIVFPANSTPRVNVTGFAGLIDPSVLRVETFLGSAPDYVYERKDALRKTAWTVKRAEPKLPKAPKVETPFEAIMRQHREAMTAEIIPMTLSVLKSDDAPSGARLAAAKLAIDRVLGDDTPSKLPHEMTPDELAEAIATIQGIAKERAVYVAYEGPADRKPGFFPDASAP